MTKRQAEELIEIKIEGTEKQECTEERYVLSLLFGVHRLLFVYLCSLVSFLWLYTLGLAIQICYGILCNAS